MGGSLSSSVVLADNMVAKEDLKKVLRSAKSFRIRKLVPFLGRGKEQPSREETSPASTVVSVKTLQAEMQRTSQQNFSSESLEEVLLERSSTYDSLNLEDLVIETNEDALINFSDFRPQTTKSERRASINFGEQIAPFMFRPISGHEEDGFEGFGIDPDFMAVKARFSTKRSRGFTQPIAA